MTLVVAEPQVSSLELAPQAWTLAQQIARTDFVPGPLRGKPEAVLACILMGNEVGVGPMQALSKIHVVDGRPAMAAELMRALAFRAGHEIWVEESNIARCTVAGSRAGSSREFRFTWTMDDAKRANLSGKNNWRHYPAAMLLARASAALCRAMCPEVLAGISYTIEELEDGDVLDAEPDDNGDTPTRAPRKAPGRTRKATRAIARGPSADAPTAAASAPEQPPLPGEADYEGPDQDLSPGESKRSLTWGQRAAMKAGEVGVSDDDRHAIYRAVSADRTTHGDDLTELEQRIAAAAIVRRGRGEDLDETLERVRGAMAKESGNPGSGSPDPGTPEGMLPTDEDGWRRELRRRNVKVAVLIRHAQLIAAEVPDRYQGKEFTTLVHVIEIPELANAALQAAEAEA
jgi:hypothetical protein